MASVRWHTFRKALDTRYPDAWLWGAFALMGAGIWGFLFIGALSEGISCRLFVALIAFGGLLAAGGAILAYRPWGWLFAALACAALAVFFLAKSSVLVAAFHAFYADLYWRGFRSFAVVSRLQDATPD